MKNLLLLGLLLTTTNVFASKLEAISTLTDKNLERARTQITALEIITHSDFKKVITLQGNGTTAQKRREQTVAQAMHSLCRFFDEGVSLGINSKDEKGSLAAVSDVVESMQIQEGDHDYDQLLAAVKTINAEPGVEVYSGSASGNNTYGNVLGFYDTKNNELAVFANTNCGSDD